MGAVEPRRERYVGQPLARIEDPALLTGRGRFLDDLDPLPGTLVAAVVRSPHPHARIVSVDLERARAHPGVAAVIVLWRSGGAGRAERGEEPSSASAPRRASSDR